MEEIKEHLEEIKEGELITPGGYRYIENEGFKIRNSVVNRRLVEDDETFEEYKVRTKLAKAHLKQSKRGNYIWLSTRNMRKEDVESEESFKFFEKCNMGTYKAIKDGEKASI